MSTGEIREYLESLDVCAICVLRYKNVSFQDFSNVLKDLENEATELNTVKRQRFNTCIACLDIFQSVNSVAQELINHSKLRDYECSSLYTSIQIPIALLLRELSLWMALIEKFPGKIDENIPPNISIKDVFKHLFNKKLCETTNRTLEQNQNGILVNVFYDFDMDHEETEKLLGVRPLSFQANCGESRKNSKNMRAITRNFFEKNFFPKNLNFDDYKKQIPVPPKTSSVPIKFARYSIDGPTVWVAGRYRKLSRDLSQTPWIIGGKRMKEDSIQELISREICPYFSIDLTEHSEQCIFISSGREDIDVRMLGQGRPFVLQIAGAKRSSLPAEVAREMQSRVDNSKQVSVQHLQLVKREDLVHIKTGEEQKKKLYRALCVLKVPVTSDTMKKLDISTGFMIQQQTPLRVLHRRPLLNRPREIFNVKGYILKDFTLNRSAKRYRIRYHNWGGHLHQGVYPWRFWKDITQYIFNHWTRH
ncbi:putative tRNA pseudouridine synthase Pus10 isoform X2 [Sitodiplosis mosellana]|uniref:putative tRNA pseudouridine synthase Pus10 isoform X2 n=1 Tax=Sitodiplosis mosellana TaxID=263140 RepID=UPI002443D129|nr:putative tRNA pseudouridine synthase Pus10 isoform X2 [Sitodiplosis mosellana]